ncbi:MAG: excinuclease ABC subunit UvrB [Patescibacteria group bacterium]
MFRLYSNFKSTPPQTTASDKISENIKCGEKDQVLLGVTGSGKTFVMANVIKNVQRPVLIISHNKTLAAQLYQEFKEFFPNNAVHYFVSYYDYYQPEAYIPQTDTYIEKDAKINEVIDRLRHEALQSLVTRNDVIIVASVSCIYNIGSPENYERIALSLKIGKKIDRRRLFLNLVRLQYERNEYDFQPGNFRIRGGFVEIFSPTGREIFKIEIEHGSVSKILKGTTKDIALKSGGIGEIEKISTQFSSRFKEVNDCKLFPAKFWVTPEDKISLALENIKLELEERLKVFKKEGGKGLEAEKLEKRTLYDMEMIKETGWCHGIENYSRHLEFRGRDSSPFTLLDYYPEDFLIFIDESHQTTSQIRSMEAGDKARKNTLIEYGFRLPSALDNRPLKFAEFERKIKQIVYVSATPGPYEISKIKSQKKKLLTELLVRPTGLLDPRTQIKPTKNQVRDLVIEIKKAIEKKERVLVTTLTKRLAEDLSDYLKEEGLKVHYLHSEIKTLQRPAILRDLRLGKYDVVVGINLLREGLDLPEVALIGILDADKEGFLRSETTLIQTMGRAARHLNGRVIMYADKITGSMKRALEESERRREIQADYNKAHGVVPKAIKKEIREWGWEKEEKEIKDPEELAKNQDIKYLRKEMEKASKELNFERAARIRDEIRKIKGK